ncbi:hypothetical protein FDUTEX481_00877 [Tolypothrix sp. PCC 7601]|nr:hypothetical protein FDUTEX481_00877 [Tolypothrix sp. PCC 7601]
MNYLVGHGTDKICVSPKVCGCRAPTIDVVQICDNYCKVRSPQLERNAIANQL